jgi:hypothetical protein
MFVAKPRTGVEHDSRIVTTPVLTYLPRGGVPDRTQSGQRGSWLTAGAAKKYRHQSHCRFTIPGIGCQSVALTARASCSSSQAGFNPSAMSDRLPLIRSASALAFCVA